MTTAPLATRPALVCVATGVVLWFAAVLLMRAIQPLGWLDGTRQVLTYALLIPGTVPFVLLLRRMADLSDGRTFAGVAVATAAALLCDGIAVGWVPELYGAEPRRAAAVILWGAGVAIWLGWLMNRTDS